MENLQKEKEAIKIVLKTLDQLKFKYEKKQEYLDFMTATYFENRQLFNETVKNIYTVNFFMEYNPEVFSETQMFTAYVDSESMKVISISIAHGNLEIIYDSKGKAIKTKFISPSFPYEKQ